MAQVQVDDTTTIMEHFQEPKDQKDDQINNNSGFKMLALTSGIHNIDLDYRKNGNSVTAYISEARLEIWRVS